MTSMPSFPKLRRAVESEGYTIRPKSRSRGDRYWLLDPQGQPVTDAEGVPLSAVWKAFLALVLESMRQNSDGSAAADGQE